MNSQEFARTCGSKVRIMAVLSVILATGTFGCGIKSAINTAVATVDARAADAIHSLDNAIAKLAEESADWRVVVTNLEKEISADVQSTIRTEVQDIARNTILLAGAEFRCNAEFMRIRLRRELTHLRNSLAESLNALLARTSISVPLLPEESPEPFICSVAPSGVDMSLEPERRTKIDIYGFDLRSRPISVGFTGYGIFQAKAPVSAKVFSTMMRTRAKAVVPAKIITTDAFELLQSTTIITHDISNALSIISDFHAVLDLTESGADIPPTAREIVLSWDNQIRSEIPILTHEKILECTTTEKVISPGTDTYIPPAVEYTQHGGGGHPDKEFDGNGPCVTLYLVLTLDPSRRILTATYAIHAWECPNDFDKIREDYTEAFGTRTITLFQAAEDERILSYNVLSSFDHRYIDTNTRPDIMNFGGLSPVEELEYVGDTDGSEAGTKTSVKVTFRQIKLQIEKCQYR